VRSGLRSRFRSVPLANVRRDLHDACRRAEIAPCSPYDLRRTISNRMVEAAVPLDIVAELMSHEDTRMLERVYGRQRTEQLATAVARSLPRAPGKH